jgi:8-oxo-dGTP pyrophosphatase MutT (NUDIX family)
MIRTAVVTAGGTSEPIDDVRVVTNLSTGRFGARLANALVESGVAVTLLASRALASHPEWLHPEVKVMPFGSFDELDVALMSACASRPDLLLMAAAVSDYAPDAVNGRIRSTGDALVVHMRRNPKLLGRLRERCGRETVLVGFKLLSGVSRGELESVARAQLEAADLDFTVANDLALIRDGQHPVILVPRQGPTIAITGSKQVTARALITALIPQPIDDSLGCLTDLPSLTALRRIEDGLVLPTLTAATAASAWHMLGRRGCGGGFALSLPRSTLLGLTDPVAFDAQVTHITGQAPGPGSPILDGVTPIGVLIAHPGGAVEPWLAQPYRTEAHLDEVLCALDASGQRLATDPSQRAFVVERGWLPDGTNQYLPPSQRDDLRRAASVCLVHGEQVLLGRRLVGAWPGHWSFPGGSIDAGETPVAGALRELREETGICIPSGRPHGSVDVAVSWGEGGRAYAVTCYVFPVPIAPVPVETEELDAHWISLAQAHSLRPMGAGTRRVLRRLPTLLEPA